MTTGQAQIYQKLKKLYADGMAELKEQTKDDTVDRKVYAITDIGRAVNLLQLQMNTIDDFISRDAFLMQLCARRCGRTGGGLSSAGNTRSC